MENINTKFKSRKLWPENSAGRIMTQKVPIVVPSLTLGEVEKYIKKEIKNIKTINYIYVVSKNKLIGVFPLKDLYRNPATKKVKDIYRKSLVFVHPETSQEHAAYLALKNNIKIIPVVNRQHILLGIIPSDSILSILYKETQKDISQLAGEHGDGVKIDNIILEVSVFKVFIRRIPWLVIGLFGGLFAAGLINSFEEVLEKNLILAAFIPLIVYMAGAVSAQVNLFLIRDFAVYPGFNLFKYFLKLLAIYFFIALFSGLLLVLLSFFIYQNALISYVLGIALVAAILSASATGMVIPCIFKKLKQDPANASGPLGTIIQDVLSIIIYFVIASLML